MFQTSVIRRTVTSAVSTYRNYSIISAKTNKIQFDNRNITQYRWSSTESKENPTPETTEAAASNNQEVDDLGDKVVNADAEKIIKLEKDVKDLKDRVIRSMAEEENVRKIAKRDVDNAKAYAVTGFAKSLLEVSDDFERAMLTVPAGDVVIADPTATLKSLLEGIKMTEKSLQKAFAQHGVIKYGKEGDNFDPALHDALFAMPDETKTSGTVSQVLKSGYKLKDRVLRPAQVGTIA